MKLMKQCQRPIGLFYIQSKTFDINHHFKHSKKGHISNKLIVVRPEFLNQ